MQVEDVRQSIGKEAGVSGWVEVTQEMIGAFGKSRFGQSLFIPDAGKVDRW